MAKIIDTAALAKYHSNCNEILGSYTKFDSATSYAAGDYCVKDGILYKFTSAHTGDWEASHVEVTNVMNEIKNAGGGAFDISEYNKSGDTPATYATLALALAGVPSAQQKGGMTIKYIDSTTSKYVQYRLAATAWSTTEADWQGVDDEPTAGSDNLVKSSGIYPLSRYKKYKNTSYNIPSATITEQWTNGYIKPTGELKPGAGEYYYSPKFFIKKDSSVILTHYWTINLIATLAAYTEDDVFVPECSFSGSNTTGAGSDEERTIDTSGYNVSYVRITYGGGLNNNSFTLNSLIADILLNDKINTLDESVSSAEDELDGIESHLTDIDTSIASIEEEIKETISKGITEITYESNRGYIKSSNGSIVTDSRFKISDGIDVVEGDVISYKIYSIGWEVAIIAAYDENDNYIIAKSVRASGTTGTWAWSEGNYTVPANIVKIKICIHATQEGQTLSVPVIESKLTILDDRIDETNTRIDGLEDRVEILENTSDIPVWRNKKWVSLGTSITDTNNTLAPDGSATGKFVPKLVTLSELNLTRNYGVAGAVFGGHILYYATHPGSYSNADLVTIEGGVNDWAGSKTLGAVGDTVPYHHAFTSPAWDNGGNDETGTFAGAVYQVILGVMQNYTNAQIVILTDNTGQYIASTGAHCERERENNLGLKQYDYTDMLVKVANYMGVNVILAGRNSMINQNNPQYLIDQIHQTELGGLQYAKAIWRELKTIPLKSQEQ